MFFINFDPMNLQDMSWDVSAIGSEDCFENASILNKKPFSHGEEDVSDEFVEAIGQENPFTEVEPALVKNGQTQETYSTIRMHYTIYI